MSLPVAEDEIALKPNSRQVLRICLNLKRLIDGTVTSKKTIPDIKKLAKSEDFIELALNACGGKGDGGIGSSAKKYRGCVIFCLLVVVGWYRKLQTIDLNTYEVNASRESAAEALARNIIGKFCSLETYLFIDVLCTKYSIYVLEEEQPARNALEMAIDLHLIPIITSAGFQKCIKYLWRGWIVQSSLDGNNFEVDKHYALPKFSSHFNPDRVKTPKYQNFLEIFFLLIYLVLFTVCVNCEVKLNYFWLEALLYLFTAGFLGDEVTKVYHVGLNYLKFWNYFNGAMYAMITVAFAVRLLGHEASLFRVLSCVAPFMWTRLLFYLDCFEYVGVIIVVISKMMKESLLFFVLLSIVVLGFLQGFIGLDTSDGEVDMFSKIFHSMVKSIIAGAQFPVFDTLLPPYSVYVYYVFRFLINVMLMKILSALYNNSYKETVGRSADEYTALFSAKVLRYVRAPDENVFIPPLNLVEWVLLVGCAPLGLLRLAGSFLYFCSLKVLYSPLLVITSYVELRQARRILYNRLKQLSDDSNEEDLAWDLTDGFRETDNDDDDDGEYNDTVVRQGLKVQRLAERQDPEFLVNLNVFNKKLNEKQEAKVDVGADVKKLSEQLGAVMEYVERLSRENGEIKAELEKLRLS